MSITVREHNLILQSLKAQDQKIVTYRSIRLLLIRDAMPVQPAINHSLKPRNLDGPSHTLNGRAPQPDFHSVL